MNSLGYASTVTVLAVSMLCANNAHSQVNTKDGGSLVAGTRYNLIRTDEVSFGPGIVNTARNEIVLKLSAAERDRSEEDNRSVWAGDLAFDRIDFLKPGEIRMYDDITDGVSYSAGLEVESTDEFDSQSEIVSSRQLGIHYGRLGPENYSSVDVGVRNFSEDKTGGEELLDDNELWSLGMTTGRRFALTGLNTSDPLWTVSLRGQFNTTDGDTIDEALESQQWYVSPGLHWNSDSFKLTADVLMPFMQSSELEEDFDYRVRAKIQTNF